MPRGMKLRRRAASRPLLPPALRRTAALVVTGCAASMVARGYHYFTDTAAGTAAGIGMVLLTALVIDRAADSPRARSPLRRAGYAPVTTAPDVRIKAPGPVGR